MILARTKAEIRNFIAEAKSQGKTIGFVPTMGALHQGHLSLVDAAKEYADIIICSIFVNPTQFGLNEDLSKYPRQEAQDLELLEKKFCDAVFIPTVDEIYPGENIIKIIPLKYTDILCGAFRPGHFEGVCLVVAKLFNIITPDYAIFGQKDFQQLFFIKKMVEELDFNVKIIGAETMRDYEGLALSSRNQYLSTVEKESATKLNKILKNAIGDFRNGFELESVLKNAKTQFLNAGFDKIDYLEFRQEDDLETTRAPNDRTRIFAAAWIGKTRLIDNLK